MGRTGAGLRLLTPVDLPRLPAWLPDAAPADPADTWAVAAMRQYGFVGVGELPEGRWRRFALVAPSLHVPRSHPGYGRCYADPRAAVLLAYGTQDGPGQRPVVLEALAGRLRVAAPGVESLECLATTGVPGYATPELEVVEAAGFRIVDADPRLPVCRLDLRGTVLSQAAAAVRRGLRHLGGEAPRPQATTRLSFELRGSVRRRPGT